MGCNASSAAALNIGSLLNINHKLVQLAATNQT